jgi:hypothetical protein
MSLSVRFSASLLLLAGIIPPKSRLYYTKSRLLFNKNLIFQAKVFWFCLSDFGGKIVSQFKRQKEKSKSTTSEQMASPMKNRTDV